VPKRKNRQRAKLTRRHVPHSWSWGSRPAEVYIRLAPKWHSF